MPEILVCCAPKWHVSQYRCGSIPSFLNASRGEQLGEFQTHSEERKNRKRKLRRQRKPTPIKERETRWLRKAVSPLQHQDG
eukprot:855687-Pelagomonas_calceolata.AAC.1